MQVRHFKHVINHCLSWICSLFFAGAVTVNVFFNIFMNQQVSLITSFTISIIACDFHWSVSLRFACLRCAIAITNKLCLAFTTSSSPKSTTRITTTNTSTITDFITITIIVNTATDTDITSTTTTVTNTTETATTTSTSNNTITTTSTKLVVVLPKINVKQPKSFYTYVQI